MAANAFVTCLLEEWEASEPFFIYEEVWTTAIFPVLEETYGDTGDVVEYEMHDHNFLVVIQDYKVVEIVSIVDVCAIVAAFAKAVVMHKYRYHNQDIDTALFDDIINA
jgi:hypothetical protein